jgi:DNA polymerase III subunit delta'
MPFRSVVGHAQIVSLLRRAATRGTVPQSLLFAGPEGVGKRTVALALAQAINCPRRKDGDGCGTCPTCLRIARGQHSDVVMISRGDEASIKIRALRDQLLDTAGYRPFEAERRIYLIDGADDMTWEAQDALLKTLEEPPSAVILVLITAYPDTLRATIQSRCRRLRFSPLTESDVARVLVERAGVAPAEARVLAGASGGSVSRALAEEAGDLTEDREAALAVLRAAGDRRLPVRLKAAAGLAQHGSKRRDREALDARLGALGSLVRDLAVLDSGGETAVTNADLEDELRRLLSGFDPRRLSAGYDLVTRARQALERNASPKIVADWLAVSI